MPTQLDRALQSRAAFWAFTGTITAVAAWAIWGNDVNPQQADPKGDPETWSNDELRRWLDTRGLMAGNSATKAELLARVKANMRAPRP